MWKFFLTCIVSAQIFATPSHVIIIRHAETNPPSEDPERHLSPLGKERSGALVYYFQDPLLALGPIEAIFVPKPSSTEPNFRTVETIEPLAKALNLPIERLFGKKEFKEMGAFLLGEKRLDGKRILLCWNHEKIDDLVKALGVALPPPEYPIDRFDLVYKIIFTEGEKPKFCLLLQKMMFGDLSTPPKKFPLCE